jgi:NADPH-dependent 2,4-dienoyl-CoA reductase/sulfur reductase-like enzyme
MLEDVLKIEKVLRFIIEAEGAVVPDELYRTGRRYRRVDAKGDCEHKPAKKEAQGSPFGQTISRYPEATHELLIDPVCARELLV